MGKSPSFPTWYGWRSELKGQSKNVWSGVKGRMFDKVRMRLLGLPRRYKRMLQIIADVILVWLSLWLAFLVRLGTEDMISPFGGHA